MSRFILQGGKKLSGEFVVAGMKNAATPMLAATMLLSRPVTLRGVPDILDVRRMCELLKGFGLKIERTDDTVLVDPTHLSGAKPSNEIVKRLRSSVLMIGPVLARTGKISFPTPGGCFIGSRPIDTHLDAFRQLGIAVEQDGNDSYALEVKKSDASLVILSEFSVTATENAVMYAALLDKTTIIRMAAAEPHVQDLCNFLVAAGAIIKGIGTHQLTIHGVKDLHVDEWRIVPDQIEIGTIAIAAAVTKSKVDIHPIVPEHLDAILTKFLQIGVSYEIIKDHLIISGGNSYKHFNLQALPYPGFPTDLQAPMAVLATQANGLSLIHDPMYNARFSYIQELTRMGAQAVVCDPHRVLLTGPTKLYGERIKSFDLRAGATLIVAGLIAEGQTIIEDAEMVDRGYERFDDRLRLIGADITREDE